MSDYMSYLAAKNAYNQAAWKNLGLKYGPYGIIAQAITGQLITPYPEYTPPPAAAPQPPRALNPTVMASTGYQPKPGDDQIPQSHPTSDTPLQDAAANNQQNQTNTNNVPTDKLPLFNNLQSTFQSWVSSLNTDQKDIFKLYGKNLFDNV